MPLSDSGADSGVALDEQLAEASRLSEEGEDQLALDLLLGLEADYPDDATLLCMIGALAAHAGAEGMAVDYFRRCLDKSPTDPTLLITAGSGLALSGDAAAEPALRMAVLTAPDLPAARLHYGNYLVRAGLLEQGLEELSTARRLDPDDSGIREASGLAYLLAGRAGEALVELEAAATGSDDPSARLLYGLALIQEGDLSRAAEELLPLAESMVEEAEVQAVLALVFGIEGWENEAWLALSRAEEAEVRVDPAALREVEEAIEGGEESMRALLLDEIAPSALRERMFRD